MIKLYSLFPAILVLLISILFISCGKDSVTGGTGNPPVTNETLIYSIDSIVVRGSGPQGFNQFDTVTHQTLSSNMRIVFNCETNCDSAFENANVDIQTWDTTSFYLVQSFYPRNQTYEFRFNVGTSFIINRIIISFDSALPRYLIARNIKIYN